MPSQLSPRLLAGFASLLVVIAALGLMALQIMGGISDRADHVATRSLPDIARIGDLESDSQRVRGLQAADLLASPAARGDIERQLGDLQRAVHDEIASLSREEDVGPLARRLETEWERYLLRTSPALDLARAGHGARAAALLDGDAAAAFDRLHAGFHAMHEAEQARATALIASGHRAYRSARLWFIAALIAGFSLAAGIGAWLLVVRPLRRASAVEGFRRRSQMALEMADSEEEALDAVKRSLELACPGTPAELLLADSSQAHLHRAVVAGGEDAAPGCPVDAPNACAAVRGGRTVVFASSEAVGACPKLRDRVGGPCSAVCTPVSVLGRTIGVLHATGPDRRPPNGAREDVLAAAVAQIGSRLGVIRAMSQSQLQASTDPLTGLLNRRSLEDRVRDLRRSGTPFAVGMADLDLSEEAPLRIALPDQELGGDSVGAIPI